MAILAEDLIQPINDAEEFFNRFDPDGSNNRQDVFSRKNLADITNLPPFKDTEWWNTEGEGAAVGPYTGIIPFRCLVDKKSNGLQLNLGEAINPINQIFKLPKPKLGSIRDESGNYKLHKFEFGIKQVSSLISNIAEQYKNLVIDAENLSTLPEEFNKIYNVDMPIHNNMSYSLEIVGRQLTSYKNLFKRGVPRLTYQNSSIPNIQTFEDLAGTEVSLYTMYDPINFNGFNKITQTIRIHVKVEQSSGNDMSFFGLDSHNIMRDKYLIINIDGSTEARMNLLNFRGIVKKHTDLYQDQLKSYILKTLNPKTVEIFDAYYNNLTSYPNVDTNIIANLIASLLK